MCPKASLMKGGVVASRLYKSPGYLKHQYRGNAESLNSTVSIIKDHVSEDSGRARSCRSLREGEEGGCKRLVAAEGAARHHVGRDGEEDDSPRHPDEV